MNGENTGSMFGLHGISGMLIAVVLLLSIVAFLTTLSVMTQQANASNPYVVTGSAVANPQSREDVYANLKEVGMIDASAKARVQDAK
ncbi:MAG: DUF4006 family protein [Campylobacterales bacterium]